MTLVSPILRSLLVYVLCMPLAIIMGYALATPLNLGNLGVFLMVTTLLALPIVLRWHHMLLLLAWNSTAIVFLLPGRPNMWLVLAALSLILSLARRSINRATRLVTVPALSWPMVFLALVVFFTAKLTGGFGLRSMGAVDVVGGKRYIILLASVVGYFAMSMTTVPVERGRLATSLFFAGGLTAAVGSLIFFIDPSLQYIYLFFPTDTGYSDTSKPMIVRYYGVSVAAQFGVLLMLARYGLKGILMEGKWWRSAVVVAAMILGLFGGFRTVLIAFALMLIIQFILEGLMQTKLIVAAGFLAVMLGVMMAALAPHMPIQVQRCLTFLPADLVDLDPMVRRDAEYSTQWRLDMWQTVLPQIPKYLLLGRGFGISRDELELAGGKIYSGLADKFYAAVLSSDFHNGTLSILLPFGIWGVLGFAWLCWVGTKSLYRNYIYSPPELKQVNTVIFTAFLTQLLLFLFVFGSFQTQFPTFTGLLGLSVALNGGVRSSVPLPEEPEEPAPLQVFRLPKPLSGT